MDKITKLNVDNIYCMAIDVIGHGISNICLRIEDLTQDDLAIPVYTSIKYRLALVSNQSEENDQFRFLLSLKGIELTEFMMDALGFIPSIEKLAGCNRIHYDRLCTLNGIVNILRFCKNDNGSYSPIVLNDDYTCSVDERTQIHFVHELQEYIRKEYHVSKTFELNRVNHFMLVEKDANEYLSIMVGLIRKYNITRLDHIREAMWHIGKYLYADDMRILMNHGCRMGIFSCMYEYENMDVILTEKANGLLERKGN